MVMAGIEIRGGVPFGDVYFTGTVRDHLGRKMSKSLGNGIDPLEVKARFGADALRYTVVSGSGAATDQYLNYENLEEAFGPGRNFANKLWNAGRFALMNLGDAPRVTLAEAEADLELMDRWILSRLSLAVAGVTASLERFRFQDAAIRAYDFFWSELADWYLEMVKPRLREDAEEASRRAARATLAEVLDGALRILHPVMPFITEVVWQKLPRAPGDPASIMVAAWPKERAEWRDEEAEAKFAELQAAISAVRNLRAEYGVRRSTGVTLRVSGATEQTRAALLASSRALDDLAGVEELSFSDAAGEIGATAVLPSGTELFVPLAGVVDLGRERARLREEVEQLDAYAITVEKKLANESFVARAPEEVVRREREKLASCTEQRERLAAKLYSLEGAA
jgi:valyl-tRNA synthetase